MSPTATRSTGTRSTGTDARVDVRKTYKLYIGGAFPRSESGHSYEVQDSKGKFVANAAKAAGGSMTLKDYVRFQLGEGIAKEASDFAAEVAAAAKG